MDRTHTFSVSHHKHKTESCSLGKLTSHWERTCGSSRSWTNLPDCIEARGRICSTPRKCRCLHNHTKSTITIPAEIFKSEIPSTKSWCRVISSNDQVLPEHDANRHMERNWQLAVLLEDFSEKDNMGRPPVSEVPRSDNDSDVLKSFKDQ